MQHQAGFHRPFPHPAECRVGLLPAPAHDQEVIRVPHHLEPLSLHQVVERVEIDVRQQRTDDRPLRASPLGRPSLGRVHHLLLEKRLDEPEHLPVDDLRPHPCHQSAVRDRVEVAFQVRIHDPRVPCLEQVIHAAKRVLASPPRSEPVAVFSKVPLEDRFRNVAHRGLHDPVFNRRNPERALLLRARLRYPHPSHRLGSVAPFPQRLRQPFEVVFQSFPVLLHRHMVDSSRSPVAPHLFVRRRKIAPRVNLVHQAEPDSSFHPLFEGRQHTIGPDLWFDPRPSGSNLSFPCSRLRHSGRFFFHLPVPFVSISLRPFAPRPLGRFLATTSALTPAQPLRIFGALAPPLRLALPGRSPCFTYSAFPTILSPTTRRAPSPLYHATPQLDGSPFRVKASPSTRGLAANVRPKRVCHPTDWSNTSHCFPPCLAAAQLCLVSGRRAYA